ncbi:MAG: pyruvate:ferredoxin-oxoacid:ferredoxin oxidoreductase, beta subunit [Candidatus Scalindua rubra]|uniref:Pyruvate:ferredoxin-oxoacid:ferredoxin oxidoreductase, beta subunit n=1 Tax=Candidatus Scalindua rubra TaxID=1872076 RepID=A0A1E3XAM7_9BACT|nr:MAG: pyruvate:ferredoxin-oxoacid:ferredoxin oxidoreductase, beta subunit [Candidatus Scalindua rubra]
MEQIYKAPKTLIDTPTHYCAGCGHGIIHRLIMEIIEEMDIRGKTIGLAPVGCAVLAYNYLDIDMCEAAHGRPPAVATGIKRVHPDKIVFSYQGDGDLAAIGTAEIIHTANRSENITVIFVNNAVYGMTNGQMAPTTLINQKTLTTPQGRNEKNDGYPLRVCEILSVIDGSRFIARTSITSSKNVIKTKQLLEKGFKTQIQEKGFSLIEILSPCPVYWRMSSIESLKFIDEEMSTTFPLGVFKDWESQN